MQLASSIPRIALVREECSRQDGKQQMFRYGPDTKLSHADFSSKSLSDHLLQEALKSSIRLICHISAKLTVKLNRHFQMECSDLQREAKNVQRKPQNTMNRRERHRQLPEHK